MDWPSLVIYIKRINRRRKKKFFFSGSPFSCYITDPSRVIVSNSVLNAHVGHSFSFDIHNPSEFLDVNITGKNIRLLIFF